MRVKVENGKIVCVAEDWKALAGNERKFLSSCRFNAVLLGFNEEGNLELNQSLNDSAKSLLRKINGLLYLARQHDIEVDEGVQEILKLVQENAIKEEEKEELEREVRLKRARWRDRLTIGCAFCPYCEKYGDGDFQCKYSGEQLSFRFSEIYNPITKAMEIFHEVGVPNKHCKDYFGEKEKAN